MDDLLDLGEITLSQSQATKLDYFASSLLEWNKQIRLTGFRSLHEIRTHLFMESILAFYSGFTENRASIQVDFGSGNGTPGLVFSILNPSGHYFLIERVEKKRLFIEHAARHLRLDNVTILSGFPETAHSPEIWMKAIAISDFLRDPLVRRHVVPPVRLYRFGKDPHPSCKHVRTCAINGRVRPWGEHHSVILSEAVFHGFS